MVQMEYLSRAAADNLANCFGAPGRLIQSLIVAVDYDSSLHYPTCSAALP